MSSKRRARLSLLALFIVVFSLCGCNDVPAPAWQSAPPHVVRIVSSLPERGATAEQAREIEQGIGLAIADHRGDTGQWSVEYMALNAGGGESGDWSPQKERENSEMAAADPAVIAYIGPYNSGATGVSLPITNRAGLLQLGPSATWPGLTAAGWDAGEPEKYFPVAPPNFVRLAPPDSVQAQAAALWASTLHISPVLVLEDGSTYSNGLAHVFSGEASRLGMAAAAPILFKPDQSEGLRASLAQTSPGGVFYAPSTPGLGAQAALVIASASRPIQVFAGDTALSDVFLEQAGASAARWHIAFNGGTAPGEDSQWAAFSRSFRKQYGTEPSPVAGRAYDLAGIVSSAVKAAGRDRALVRDTVVKTSAYSGVTGRISFNARGDPTAWRVQGYIVTDGEFVPDHAITRADAK